MSESLERRKREGEESWISISDLMAGLMMVFLLIAVIYAKDANQRGPKCDGDCNPNGRTPNVRSYDALFEEFKADLEKWNAVIDKDSLTVRFRSPEVLFKSGSAELELRFQEILSDFVPRYVELLRNRFDSTIREVRIEGHTSSEWSKSVDATEAFIKNMELSQERTRAVLAFSMAIPRLQAMTPWMRKESKRQWPLLGPAHHCRWTGRQETFETSRVYHPYKDERGAVPNFGSRRASH